jgi:hypothetical protein
MSRPIAFASVDEYLGPAAERFFGAGYRRAGYTFSDLTVASDGSGAASLGGHVAVAYPADWSRKKRGVDLRPHLSTVDVLLIAAQMADLLLVHGMGLSAAVRRKAWISSVTLKAGPQPQEDLEAVPISAELRPLDGTSGPSDRSSVVDCQVGVMRARCEVVHGPPPRMPAAAATVVADLDHALGSASQRYWGEGYRADSQAVTDVSGDVEDVTVWAQLHVNHGAAARERSGGLGAEYEPGVSLIDAFVGLLQLVQVLLYHLDDVDRAETNTLWMVRTRLRREQPHRQISPVVPARVRITAKHLLQVRGATWRNVDVEGAAGGVELRCNFAHELTRQPASNAV